MKNRRPVTDSPAVHNAPLAADGPGRDSFSNTLLLLVLLGVPIVLSLLFGGGLLLTVILILTTLLPLLAIYWMIISRYSLPPNNKVKLPNRSVEHYITFKSDTDKAKWSGRNTIPIHTFGEMYIDGKVTFNGDCLEMMEYRHDWSNFSFTWSLCRYIVFTFGIDTLFHTRAQDMDQVRPNYDQGDDHYSYFLGPRMVYTSGVISDTSREETLEEMQDNKMAIVCEKLELREGETLLDIGCGWGTLAKFASVNYGAKVTGVTLARNQTAWGNEGLQKSGIPDSQSKILCMDYRDVPRGKKFDKISQLEMGEHVGVRRLTTFFRQCYDMLEDDGAMYVQLSGLRQAWQYEDFIWGSFLNKYIFRGADASTPLWNYTRSLEMAGFEIKSVDTIGVHYSGTLWRWYRNWLSNREKIEAKFGERWYRIWELFLAWSTIASRQGSAACFQILVVKNLNGAPRIDGVTSQYGLAGALERSRAAGKSSLE
ncbi:S-adenosyl-L-methionine-dependent methyltransferase [Aaosphaeria arxii CBS 175.79]|uniref:sphingolipid C(9)-methyltransferase n=1 Tax=Aaosphaeria arxii CBS 175.79 TaxID=1450172 RepID=A0A6A5XJS9_9PLEO|nr:S-adenosyl-L-methionine-dependent methyltransferase [Aaosphaeria arxii CBS 175.79]KAF2012990.1 S-adenosyl-L-methionine-dependent methyltransferase [Aaosphaeria arxii CBS 175.79]